MKLPGSISAQRAGGILSPARTTARRVMLNRMCYHQPTIKPYSSIPPPPPPPMQQPILPPPNTTILSTSPTTPNIHALFDPPTSTWQYLIADPTTSAAAIIDPVLDYDPTTQTITTTTADTLLALAASKQYTISHILETHIHADHLTAAAYLQARLAQSQPSKPPICAGHRISQVQRLFAARYAIPAEEYQPPKGGFDRLFQDDETFRIGGLEAVAVHLPGHTPDHLGYLIGGENLFSGDSLFHPDIGTARCDFPGGSPEQLWASGQKVLALAPDTKVWAGHDYPPPAGGRKEVVPYVTVREHQQGNRHLKKGGPSREEFVRLRGERDRGLGEPRLLHVALQVNVRGGRMPAPIGGEGGLRLLRVPVRGGKSWE